MDAATALKHLTYYAEIRIEADEKARTALAAALANTPATELTTQIERALRSSAIAKPWRQLMQAVERYGVREGLLRQQGEALNALLSYGMGMSTCMVANAARLAEEDGLRRFLGQIDTIEIAEDDAPAPEPEPTPKPTMTRAAKATPAQKRTLTAIKEAGVVLSERSASEGPRVTVNLGHVAPRRDMVEAVITKGWAARDTSTSLFNGQAVTLTAAGEAILTS